MSSDDVKLLFEGFGTLIILIAGSVIAIGVARVWLKRIDRGPSKRSQIEEDRLQHLEQAVDAIAVEVERISEAQRFSAKLLAGRGSDAERAPADAIRPGATTKTD